MQKEKTSVTPTHYYPKITHVSDTKRLHPNRVADRHYYCSNNGRHRISKYESMDCLQTCGIASRANCQPAAFARNEAVRLNLPVYICPVKIKSDGSPNNGCDSKYAGNGMLAYADKNGDSNYKNDTVDLSVRSIILNGDTKKVEYSFNYIPTSTERPALSASASKEVWWRFLPNGTFGHSTDGKNYQFSDGYIKISLTDKSAADAETKKARATVLLVNGNGHVEICAKNDERKICEYTSK